MADLTEVFDRQAVFNGSTAKRCALCLKRLNRQLERVEPVTVEYFSGAFRLRYPNARFARAHWRCIQDFLRHPERYVA